mmetsp:Transcript_18030/g.46081  ORF Transcript_18030/g.46081 Transcript_18030/m.46081 type:complete len:232 (-) Transcript_18030:386-1081(-)
MQSLRKLVLLALLAFVAVAHGQEEPTQPAAAGAAVEDVEGAAEASVAAEEIESVAVDGAEEEVGIESSGADPAAARAGAASVQWVVTQKMRTQLNNLGYTDAEIEELDAERAAAIIRRSISRPNKGVPSGWNKGERRKGERSAVGLRGSLLGAVGKLPGGPALPVAALVGVGSLVFGMKGASAAAASAAVERVLAEPDDSIIESVPDNSDELWLDRQIDKLILALKRMLGK